MSESNVDELAAITVAFVVASVCVFFYFVPIPDPTLEEMQAEEILREKKERVSGARRERRCGQTCVCIRLRCFSMGQLFAVLGQPRAAL
jgi:hypothetical protein